MDGPPSDLAVLHTVCLRRPARSVGVNPCAINPADWEVVKLWISNNYSQINWFS